MEAPSITVGSGGEVHNFGMYDYCAGDQCGDCSGGYDDYTGFCGTD